MALENALPVDALGAQGPMAEEQPRSQLCVRYNRYSMYSSYIRYSHRTPASVFWQIHLTRYESRKPSTPLLLHARRQHEDYVGTNAGVVPATTSGVISAKSAAGRDAGFLHEPEKQSGATCSTSNMPLKFHLYKDAHVTSAQTRLRQNDRTRYFRMSGPYNIG